jgi:hypothetical protein
LRRPNSRTHAGVFAEELADEVVVARPIGSPVRSGRRKLLFERHTGRDRDDRLDGFGLLDGFDWLSGGLGPTAAAARGTNQGKRKTSDEQWPHRLKRGRSQRCDRSACYQ